jgi:hypothetical protein
MKKTLFSILVLFVLGGCHAEERKAPREPLPEVKLQSFALGDPSMGDLNDQVLFNNKVFLWNDPPSAAIAEMVIRAGNQVDLNEDEGIAVRSRIRKTEADLEAVNTRLAAAVEAMDQAVKDALDQLRSLAEEQSTLAPEESARSEEISREMETLNAGLPALSAEAAEAKSSREALYGEYGRLFREQLRIGRYGEDLVNLVIANTTYFQKMPERVTFNFRPGKVDVTITAWPTKDDTHSTAGGTITNVTYEPLGGVLRFDVETVRRQEYYRFRISRSRLDVTDGRIFYQGDLRRYRGHPDEGGVLERRGVVKFATSN